VPYETPTEHKISLKEPWETSENVLVKEALELVSGAGTPVERDASVARRGIKVSKKHEIKWAVCGGGTNTQRLRTHKI